MKKVKFFLLAAALVGLMASCSENAVSPTSSVGQTISASQVPAVVQTTLTTSYPSATNTTWSKVAPTVYQASFQANATSLISSISSTGKVLYTHAKIDPSTLPATIISYLDTNYAGYVIKKAGSRTDSTGVVQGYMVEFTLNSVIYEVRFDASGSFLSLEMGDGSHECAEVAKADLPAAITTYLDANYSGYTFNHAMANNTAGTISGYGVEITYNSAKVRLLFDASGTFISLDLNEGGKGHPGDTTKGGGPGKGDHGKGKPGGPGGAPTQVTQANLLSAITTYLNTTYSGFTFVGAVSFSDRKGIVGYGVKITYQGKDYELEFDATGNFLKAH